MTEERLGFHPASAYNYSGEREACKVTSCVMSSGVETSLVIWLGSSGYLGLERFDALTSRSLSLRPSRLSRGFPQPLDSPLRFAPVEMTKDI